MNKLMKESREKIQKRILEGTPGEILEGIADRVPGENKESQKIPKESREETIKKIGVSECFKVVKPLTLYENPKYFIYIGGLQRHV